MPAVTIINGQMVDFLRNVGTFDAAAFNEVRPLGTTIVPANGAMGFNVPSLLSVFAGAPYLHSGSATTLDQVLQNVTHRSAGTGGVDTLTSAADRAKVVKFLQSIDAATAPFP
jgi:cytochrome c peroxidase